MELAERKEKKQKELESLQLKHRQLLKYVNDLKKKNQELDQEIFDLTKRRTVLQGRKAANKVADEFDQYKELFRPETSIRETAIQETFISEESIQEMSIPEAFISETSAGEISEPAAESTSSSLKSDTVAGELSGGEEAPEEFQEEPDRKEDTCLRESAVETEETFGEAEEGTVQEEDLSCEQEEEKDLPESARQVNYVMSQKELLELVRSISREQGERSEEIVVRKVSAGAKALEIFYDLAGIFFKILLAVFVAVLLSLAATVLINAELRNALLEFIRNVGV